MTVPQKVLQYQREWRKRNPEKAKLYAKKWRQANPEKRRQLRRRYKKKYPDKIREWRKRYKEKNREKIRETDRKYKLTHKSRYSSYKGSAKQRSITFHLDYKEFTSLISNPCHYCGKEPPSGIDRKNSKAPYIIDNCVPCCKKCNYFKKFTNYETFIERCKAIGKYLNSSVFSQPL